jgi:hypothetical protein
MRLVGPAFVHGIMKGEALSADSFSKEMVMLR